MIPSAGGSLRLVLLRRLLVAGLVGCRFLDRRARLGLFEEFCPERACRWRMTEAVSSFPRKPTRFNTPNTRSTNTGHHWVRRRRRRPHMLRS